MILGVGIDLVETGRFATAIERGGDRFLDRIFTRAERDYCGTRVERLAARFAAKEAVAKAFGTGIGGEMAFSEIEVGRRENGAPFIILHGTARATAAARGAGEIFLSLTHTEQYAAAHVVVMDGPTGGVNEPA